MADKDRFNLVLKSLVEDAPLVVSGSPALLDVCAECVRRLEENEFDVGFDSDHKVGSLALAACCYAMPKPERQSLHSSGVSVWRMLWPWADREWWNPTDRRTDLVKAAALIIAEIERLDRVPAAQSGEPSC